MDPLHSQPSQEYPIRALVRANNDIGLPKEMEGRVSNWKKVGSDIYDSENVGYMALEANLIIDPTPQDIAEERAKAGLPAEPSEGKKDLEPVREDAHRSPSGSECVSRDGRRFRRLGAGEMILKGDFCLEAHENIAEEIPTPVCQWDFKVYNGMRNNYYRPIQGAAEGEALPEAPAEGSPSKSWWCPHCQRAVIPQDVTYSENHDPMAGGCGRGVMPGAPSAPSVTMGGAVEALRGLLDRYLRLVNSGDAGNWDPEDEVEVIAARAALSKLEGR